MTTIYFIRHGQASFGAARYDQLSNTGELQAKMLGRYFDQIFKEAPLIFSGAMQRHQQTASLALAECFPEAQVITDSAWNEFNHQQVFSRYEPRFNQPHLLQAEVAKEANPRAYLATIFEAAISRWTEGEHHHEYDESWPDFKQRVETALQSLCEHLKQSQPRYAVIFTSGGVISVAVGHLLGLNPTQTFALNWAIANSSITTLRLIDHKLQLLSLNEHHFIKAENANLLTWI